jgi:hypothetical protein
MPSVATIAPPGLASSSRMVLGVPDAPTRAELEEVIGNEVRQTDAEPARVAGGQGNLVQQQEVGDSGVFAR